MITALLVYFGVVYTRGRLAYYGIHIDLADLSTRDLVLYGTEALYAPAALLLLAILAALGVHAAVTWMLASPGRATANLLTGAAIALAGVLLIARALIGMLISRVARDETPGTTPLAVALGPMLLTYGGWIVLRAVGARRAGSPGASGTRGQARLGRLARTTAITVAFVALAGLFWAVNSFAFALGLSRGYDEALDVPRMYGVVLDTKEPLVDLPDGVTETPLAPGEERDFQYRYRGLRLVLESGGRLFLVPERWTRQSRTFVVPYDAEVRIQLIPPPALTR